jgi:tetratricopeptide (TPR) repeat protein
MPDPSDEAVIPLHQFVRERAAEKSESAGPHPDTGEMMEGSLPANLSSTESFLADELDDLGEDVEPSPQAPPADRIAAGKRIALVGRFGSMNHREAANVLQSYGAEVVDLPRPSRTTRPKAADDAAPAPLGIDWLVIGASQSPLSQTDLLPRDVIERAGRGELEILQETELWERLGLVEIEQSARQYYTPVMLAELLGVSVRIVRRWQRRGLIQPVAMLHKLPYFDFAEVATAKRLAGWIAAGANHRTIESRLAELVEVLPNIRRPLDQLSILVEGRQVLLRQGDGLIEPGGQMRFNFDLLDEQADGDEPGKPPAEILSFEPPDQPPMLRAASSSAADDLLAAAYQAEDDDDLEAAIDLYHAILARDGPRAEISFQLAELLYRLDLLYAARERYYVTIELDPDFVEARASLGAVLAELGQYELAIAALRGAISLYEDYVDAHYLLAKTLGQVGQEQDSREHWRRLLDLAPESPWADEARQHLDSV